MESKLTIKRRTAPGGQWQDFIEREHNSVDQLIRESFAEYCKDRKASASLNRRRAKSPQRLFQSLPRRRTPDRTPPGIEELEKLYAPMRDLLRPLPGAEIRENVPRFTSLQVDRDEDLESEAASVVIPPPLAPVQSHALLEELPKLTQATSVDWRKTPLNQSHTLLEESHQLTKLGQQLDWRKTPPPLPPRRSSSKPSLFKKKLPESSSGIYANAKMLAHNHRSSLMSTGSSENSSSDASLAHAALGSELVWPSTWKSALPSPSEEHRSVSQMTGEVSGSCASPNASGVYVKMDYTNVLRSNSVMSSPYIPMTRRKRSSSTTNSAKCSVIYATPTPPDQLIEKRGRSNSTSRLQEVASRARRRFKSGLAQHKAQFKGLAQFKDLMAEVERKRHFRVGLNLFNADPEAGVAYLAQKDFIESASPVALARFLLDEPGLSRDKVGEYLTDLRSAFAARTLSAFMQGVDFSGLRVDKALRRLLRCLRVPGEAQKIERLTEEFGRRYAECNRTFNASSCASLAFALLMLNTDLHSQALPKERRRMTAEDFVSNLAGAGADFDVKLLRSIYKSISRREFSSCADHVLQTRIIEQRVVFDGKHNQQRLSEPHRRLVCLCRLYQVADVELASGDGLDHPRDVFLFNDLLLVTKQQQNKNYSFKCSLALRGLEVSLFHTSVFAHGIQLSKNGKSVLTLNARSEHDRYKFVMDLQESILEMEWTERAMLT